MKKLLLSILLLLLVFGCDRSLYITHIKPENEKFYKSFNIEDKTYSRDIVIFVTEDTIPVIEYLNSYGAYQEGDFNSSSGLTYQIDYATYIVWISKNQPDIVVHELFHVTSYILNGSGIKLTNDTEEVYAYYIDFLTREYYKNLNDE